MIKDKDSIRKLAMSRFQDYLDSIKFSESGKLENWDGNRMITNIKSHKVRTFIESFQHKKIHGNDYLAVENIDEIWLNENKSRLLKKWIKASNRCTEERQDSVLEILSDFKLFKRFFRWTISSYTELNFNDLYVSLITKSHDTIKFVAGGKEKFLIPWMKGDKSFSYNPMISKHLYNLLPDNKHFTNRSDLIQDWESVENKIINRINELIKCPNNK
ncbi:hypothetical protein [Salinivirga cyanobacteriivorans]